MATITIAAGTQPFIKTTPVIEKPQLATAGENLSVVIPVYLKQSDRKLYTADSDPATAETSVVAGITITKSETSEQVSFVAQQGTVIDFAVALTFGTVYYLVGSGAIGERSDITTADEIVRVGYANSDGDFVVDILKTGEVKEA